MFAVDAFSLSDMLECSSGLRAAAAPATSMEEGADAIVRYLHAQFVDKASGEAAFALVRFYKTHLFQDLEPDLQDFALSAADANTNLSGVRCLTLLATAGDERDWNDRSLSRSHKAIPLPGQQALLASPMIARLIQQLGVDPTWVLDPDPSLFRELDQETFDVFFVPDAVGSEYVPAQSDFVLPYGVRSVLGFGGILSDSSLFAVVMFSKVPIPAETADAFKTIAVSTKLAMLSFAHGKTFISQAASQHHVVTTDEELARARSEIVALNQLLEVRQDAVISQSRRLEAALQHGQERHEQVLASQAALASSEARKTAVIQGALDSLISMDRSGGIVEWNPAAEATFGYTTQEAIGQRLSELIIPYRFRARHRAGLELYFQTGVGPILNQRVEVTALHKDGTEFPVELTITPVDLPDGHLFTGYVRDITERRAAEERLLESRERFAHIARTLQASLLPPALPPIPGLDLGSVYQPAGAGNEVGGDFYDVFQTGKSDWTLTLGDVCGKGPEAAALTALVRYTVRAAAMRARRPTSVLATLNEAVHRQHPESFCTITYARVRIDGQRTRVTLGSGGHPPALLMSADGDVSEITATGLLIGPFETWTGHERTVSLQGGDVLVLYSDGLTEAGTGPDRFGPRIINSLSETAGFDAQTTAEHLLRCALDFAGTVTDDLAILVARVPDAPGLQTRSANT